MESVPHLKARGKAIFPQSIGPEYAVAFDIQNPGFGGSRNPFKAIMSGMGFSGMF